MAGSFTDELVLVEPRGTMPLVRPRRSATRLVPKALGRRTVELAEGPASTELLQREGSYRRILALADVLVATVVLLLITHLSEAADFSSAMLVTLPLIVVVNKVCGLYERDELVLKKSTLDEVPMLLQIAGLFALIVWLIHDGLGTASLEARDVMLIWASTFEGSFSAGASRGPPPGAHRRSSAASSSATKARSTRWRASSPAAGSRPRSSRASR